MHKERELRSASARASASASARRLSVGGVVRLCVPIWIRRKTF